MIFYTLRTFPYTLYVLRLLLPPNASVELHGSTAPTPEAGEPERTVLERVFKTDEAVAADVALGLGLLRKKVRFFFGVVFSLVCFGVKFSVEVVFF